MIYELVRNALVPEASIAMDDGNQIAIKVVGEKRSRFAGTLTYSIVVLYWLRTQEVNFTKAADLVIAHLGGIHPDLPMKIKATWIVLGSRAGILLFDHIAVKENLAYRGMASAVCTIDLEDGKTFFRPGIIENEIVSRRIEYLAGQRDLRGKAALGEEFGKVLDVLLSILDGVGFHGKAKRIEADQGRRHAAMGSFPVG